MGRFLTSAAVSLLALTACSRNRDIPVLNQCATTRTIALEWAPVLDYDLAPEELAQYDVAAHTTTVIEDVYPPGSARGSMFVWTGNRVRVYGIDPSADPVLQRCHGRLAGDQDLLATVKRPPASRQRRATTSQRLAGNQRSPRQRSPRVSLPLRPITPTPSARSRRRTGGGSPAPSARPPCRHARCASRPR